MLFVLRRCRNGGKSSQLPERQILVTLHIGFLLIICWSAQSGVLCLWLTPSLAPLLAYAACRACRLARRVPVARTAQRRACPPSRAAGSATQVCFLFPPRVRALSCGPFGTDVCPCARANADALTCIVLCAGYYCPAGSQSATQTMCVESISITRQTLLRDLTLALRSCPIGAFCVASSEDYFLCPAGELLHCLHRPCWLPLRVFDCVPAHALPLLTTCSFAGRYGSTTALSASTCSGLCSQGDTHSHPHTPLRLVAAESRVARCVQAISAAAVRRRRPLRTACAQSVRYCVVLASDSTWFAKRQSGFSPLALITLQGAGAVSARPLLRPARPVATEARRCWDRACVAAPVWQASCPSLLKRFCCSRSLTDGVVGWFCAGYWWYVLQPMPASRVLPLNDRLFAVARWDPRTRLLSSANPVRLRSLRSLSRVRGLITLCGRCPVARAGTYCPVAAAAPIQCGAGTHS